MVLITAIKEHFIIWSVPYLMVKLVCLNHANKMLQKLKVKNVTASKSKGKEKANEMRGAVGDLKWVLGCYLFPKIEKAKKLDPRIPAVQEVLRPRDFFFILEQEILW